MNNRAKTFRERQEDKQKEKGDRIFNAIIILLTAGGWFYILNGVAEALAK